MVKIKPGEFFATTRPYVIATVLGSCVSACIRDTLRGGAGMNHFMLPRRHVAGNDGSVVAESLRYGVFAMESLINEFIRRGARRSDLEVKVFGGASVMEFTQGDVGKLNAEFVIAYLAAEGIATAAADLGGPYPRKILQFAHSGQVFVKYLSRLTNDTIEDRESQYALTLVSAPRLTEVELF